MSDPLQYKGPGELYQPKDYWTKYKHEFCYVYFKNRGHSGLIEVISDEEDVWELYSETGYATCGAVLRESPWRHKLEPGIKIVQGTYDPKDSTWINKLHFQPLTFSQLKKVWQGESIR